MKISLKEWIIFILVAVFCFCLWLKFGYSRFSFVDLSIGRNEALSRAESYLKTRGADIKAYSRSIVFGMDRWADRYLQKTMGLKKEEEFIRQHNYELFYWKVRYFKQFQKEEYVIELSPKSGKILSFKHLIDDIALSAPTDKDIARSMSEEFLKKNFGIDLDAYDFHEQKIKRYERRTDCSFSWERKGIDIAWKKNEGTAKLLIGTTVSGDEIREFYVNNLDVPEKFRRHVEGQLIFGEYISGFYSLIFIFLVISSIFIVLKKRYNVVTRFCKKWFLYLAIFLALINLASIFNNIQSAIARYRTSASLVSFIGIHLVKEIINLLFLSVAFILPGIAGESLRYEVFPDKRYSSFMYYLRTTFYSRGVSRAIIFGYVLFFIMLGLQSGIFYLGQRYLGVWKEWFKLTQFSSAYLPFFGAFTVGISASLNEEVLFRLFGISWGKKYFKNTVLAILLASLIWGFGHSEYAIFPVWFRGIEVSIIGIVYGSIFVKYGLIPLIVTHYLFDVFLGIAAHILGHSSLYLFSGAIFVLAIPLVFAAVAYFFNKKEKEKEITLMLDDLQKYNLGILTTFVSSRKSQGISAAAIRQELIAHNWDINLVDLAINAVFNIR